MKLVSDWNPKRSGTCGNHGDPNTIGVSVNEEKGRRLCLNVTIGQAVARRFRLVKGDRLALRIGDHDGRKFLYIARDNERGMKLECRRQSERMRTRFNTKHGGPELTAVARRLLADRRSIVSVPAEWGGGAVVYIDQEAA